MKLRKVLAMVCALVLVISVSAAAPASAGTISFSDCKCDWFVWNAEYSQIQVDLLASGIDLSEICDVRMTLIIDDLSGGCGGGYILNSQNGGWDQHEWGNDGAGKEITIVPTGNENEYYISFGSTTPLYTDPGSWAQVVISQWWGPDFTISRCDLLNASGAVLATTPAAADTPVAQAELPQTGVASAVVFYVLGAGLVAGGAAVTKKSRRK